MQNQNIIDKLITFKERKKLSDEQWEERGLIPSDKEISNTIEKGLNQCADKLIEVIGQNTPKNAPKEVLNQSIKSFKRLDYDTEEAEFICELFFELSVIVNITQFGDFLNIWLYGADLAKELKKLNKKAQKIIDTLKQPCTMCNEQLETYIIQRNNDNYKSGWFIVACNNCAELNLIEPGPGIKELRMGNYKWVETLFQDDFTHETALIHLKNLKSLKK